MEWTRRGFLGSAAALSSPGPARAAKSPNFVFVIADDHAGYALGCDGSPYARTPNLDRLASEGMRFARHHCNSPVCTPSRQSFLTGQLPHAAGVTRLQTRLSSSKTTLAKQFKKAGYATAVFGKMHFNEPGTPGLHGFDYLLTEAELQKAWMQAVRPSALPSDSSTKKLPWQPFKDPARIWLNADKLPYPRVEAEMKGSFLASRAIEYLEQNQSKQFALWVSFQEPHSPFDFPVDYKDRVSPQSIETPRTGPDDAWQVPLIFRPLTPDDKRGINAAYYTSVAHLDNNIGKVLAALRRLRLEENTLVVYMADHGYNLGHHGRFEKHCSYDPALRVPLLMRWPGHLNAGVVNEFTESVDVPVTISELLSLPPLPDAHGQNLMRKRRDLVFSEYLENEEACVRTQRWKYVYCSGRRARTDGYDIDKPMPGRWQRLYDLEKDPGEFTDLAVKHGAKVAELRGALLERFRTTHPEVESEPQRLAPEDALDWYLRPRDADVERPRPA